MSKQSCRCKCRRQIDVSEMYVCSQGCINQRALVLVGVLRAHVHLQQDPLREGLEALAALPQMPVTELRAQLAGGGRAGQNTLVLPAHLTQAGLHVTLVQQREAPRAGRLGEDHGARQEQRGRRGFGALAEGLERVLTRHGLDDSRRHVHCHRNSSRTSESS